MTHFAIICPAVTGHLNPMFALGRELQRRGHRVTFIGVLDAQATTLAAGLEFRAIAESEYPLGAIPKLSAQLGELSGLAALRYAFRNFQQQLNAALLRDAPGAIEEAGVEALLVDQVIPVRGTLAEFLDIPLIEVCNALIENPDDTIPPFFTTWSYNPAWWARLRNLAANLLFSRIVGSIEQVNQQYRRQWKLPLHSSSNERFSPLATVSQQPAEFEFPRQTLPDYFHFTGPYHDSSGRVPVDFPYEKLTGQPLIYASMGTLQNRQQKVFQCIAEACVGLDAQLVISLGDSGSPESLQGLPGNPLVVGYAPQLELLKKATLTITHAGLNTTLECLTDGVPMVAIPIAFDQLGNAARIAWTGAGEFVPLSRLSVPRLRGAIQRVLTQESYKKNATRLQEAIRKAGGVSRAADIIEQAVSIGKPVLAQAR
ncbi:glycosyltransferase [Coleofasciculus sp. FACHB-SPT9]|uniref:glycosyltransferase n=1 Tax=Cyanophyceae TaxID=3028117 RepID=UPI001685E709|nr:glycosyltransferase [Coleofasciculus sp. FACHB-SPT9]MBD1889722.1 glycosyltransferase [Coleofasciculus sp. FACHB-SPT9]